MSLSEANAVSNKTIGSDKTATIHLLRRAVVQFTEERDWSKFHTPQELATSISIEAAELLEIFQWHMRDDVTDLTVEQVARVREELADVIIYCLSMANTMDLDVAEIVTEKMEKNAVNYPVERCRGMAQKYTELQDE